MNTPNPKIVLATVPETTGSASFGVYIPDANGGHKVASPHRTPHIIGPIPFATVREHDNSEDNPANYPDWENRENNPANYSEY